MGTYLSEILAEHRAQVAADRRDLDDLIAAAAGAPAPRGFRAALAEGASEGLGVIAEIKRRSPSRGDLAPALDPAALGAAYATGGARALSVLTDERFFGGSAADLARARSAVGLPVLRKDFTLGPADVADARLMGADAVLLIVAALAPTELVELGALARQLALDALVEVHDEAELEAALAAGASLVGVNQRDLTSFGVDGQRAVRLARRLPASVVAVAESGVGGPEDAARLADAGYAAVLVGEHLVTATDPAAAVRALSGFVVGRLLGADAAPPVSDPPFIKICGITSEADALLAVGLGADALGFVLAPSPRQLSPSAVADIVKRVPHGVLTVGVFRDEAPQRVVEIANHAGLGAVQLHGHETAESCRWVRQRVSCSIKAFSAGDRTIARFGEFSADFLLVDGANPGSGDVFDWRLAEGVADPGRLIVSGGLTADNVGQAVAHLHPFGVDVSSGVESEPGRKDPRRLREFVVAAREAGAELARLPDGPTGAGAEDEEPYDWMEG